MTDWMARLDKSGWRILCYRIPCGFELARIVEYSPPYRTLHGYPPDPARFAGIPEGVRHAAFPPGWYRHRDTGAWCLSDHAWDRIKRGRAPRFRSSAYMPHIDGRPILAERLLDELPATVVCPACGLKQRFDAGVLRIAAHTIDATDPEAVVTGHYHYNVADYPDLFPRIEDGRIIVAPARRPRKRQR